MARKLKGAGVGKGRKVGQTSPKIAAQARAASKLAGRKRKPRRIKDYEQLGDAPADELEAMAWLFKALAVRARQVMTDKDMTDRDRGVELRTQAKVMNQLMPKVRLWKAEKALRAAKKRQEATTVVNLEAAPKAAGAPPPARVEAAPGLEPAPVTKPDEEKKP